MVRAHAAAGTLVNFAISLARGRTEFCVRGEVSAIPSLNNVSAETQKLSASLVSVACTVMEELTVLFSVLRRAERFAAVPLGVFAQKSLRSAPAIMEDVEQAVHQQVVRPPIVFQVEFGVLTARTPAPVQFSRLVGEVIYITLASAPTIRECVTSERVTQTVGFVFAQRI